VKSWFEDDSSSNFDDPQGARRDTWVFRGFWQWSGGFLRTLSFVDGWQVSLFLFIVLQSFLFLSLSSAHVFTLLIPISIFVVQSFL